MVWLSTNVTSSRKNQRTDPNGTSALGASGAAITTSDGCDTQKKTGCHLDQTAETEPSLKNCAIIYSA
jgi:hypothetical protein